MQLKSTRHAPTPLYIAIVAGGTGGHVFPALAVFKQLIARGHQCIWIGRPHSIESRTANQNGCVFFPVKVSGVRGRRITSQLVAFWQTLVAVIEIYRLFTKRLPNTKVWPQGVRPPKRKPDVLIAFGGYTSVAAGIAAWCSRTSLVIHEQNSYAGSANRLLARWAKCVCCGFTDVFVSHPRRKIVGNPVRFTLRPNWHYDDKPLRVLVMGGSNGAASLNKAMVNCLDYISLPYGLHLVHQCGTTTYQQTQAEYADLFSMNTQLANTCKVRLQAFLCAMPMYYGWCDMIICRAGAITIAEVAMSGKFAFLVPFPFATDNHQFHNASALVKSGAADVIHDNVDMPQRLADSLAPLLAQPPAMARKKLNAKGRASLALAIPNSSKNIANIVVQIAKNRMTNLTSIV